MMNKHKNTTLMALEALKGDNLERAMRAWGNMTPEQMGMPHGASGYTRQEILDGYIEHRAEVQGAIEWVMGCHE
jgi:hypothetical protein